MDWSNPASFNHRTELLSTGHTYHFVDQVPRDYNPMRTPTLLCVHGFPDLWYGWRYVIPSWVQTCGWRVVVPDMLGYGATDKPADPKYYSTKSLCADIAALLDLIGVQKAVVIGHDWGAAISWRFALWHPDRIQALVAMSIPYTPPRSVYLPLEEVAEQFPAFGYQLYFCNQSSTREIEENLPTFFRVLYGTDGRGFDHKNRSRPINLNHVVSSEHPGLLDAKEFDYYLENFKQGGMNGPLNYYRTIKHRFDEEETADLRLSESLPILFIWGDADRTCEPYQVERMYAHMPLLRDVRVRGKGHWLAMECKDIVIDSVIKFVQELYSEGSLNSRL